MLTPDEEKYLETIPEDRKITILDFDPAVKAAADKVVIKIRNEKPDLEVLSMGSSDLGIAGQNDIDISVLSTPETFKDSLPVLEKLFGPPSQRERLPMKWVFGQDGFEVEMHLSDSTTETFKRHLRVYTALKENSELRERYEKMKKSFDGKSFREYMRKKFEFFHEILD